MVMVVCDFRRCRDVKGELVGCAFISGMDGVRGAPSVAQRGLTDGEEAQDGLSPRASACEAGDGPEPGSGDRNHPATLADPAPASGASDEDVDSDHEYRLAC